ncbi:hypothetical protein VNI00_006129 [Paramarasmius palmivorus]|uniref:F-box domain-containing protein n=1 Tax=Paramarasmius palmivorus TaxID=297713 RepID=A0AAW0D4Z8_9AGAR
MVRRSKRLESAKANIPQKATTKPGKTSKGDSNRKTKTTSRPTAKRAKMGSTSKNVAQPEVSSRNSDIRGLLQKFLKDAPLDVMLEILAHLSPRDILNFARTNTEMRQVLMSRNNAVIWRTAIKNAKLPPLPQDLTELQYAALAFDTYCYACGRGGCDNIMWEFRVRCHKKCIEELFLTERKLQQQDFWTSSMGQMMRDLEPSIPKVDIPRRYWGSSQGFLPEMLQRLSIEYAEVEYNEEERKAWIGAKTREFDQIRENSRACNDWKNEHDIFRKADRDEIRVQRTEDIIDRLAELGWDDDDLNQAHFIYHPLVHQPKELTDQGWDKIKGTIIEHLERRREERIAENRRAVYEKRYRIVHRIYEQYCKETPFGTIYPPVGSLITLLKSTEELIWSVPWDEELSEERIAGVLRDELPSLVDNWQSTADERLLESFGGLVDRSSAGTIVCVCLLCKQLLWGSRIYFHSCFTSEWAHGSPNVSKQENWATFFDPFRELRWRPWTPQVEYCSTASENLRKIVDLCGLGSTPNALWGLERLDPLLECAECSNEDKGRLFMRWSRAVQHADGAKHTVFGLADENLKLQITRQERDPYSSHSVGSGCTLCVTDRTMRYRNIRGHLQVTHGLREEEIRREHWYWDENEPWNNLHPFPVRYKEA